MSRFFMYSLGRFFTNNLKLKFRMLSLSFSVLFGMSSVVLPGNVFAVPYSGPQVVINEVQTGSLTSANEEFIEILNLGEDSVDVAGWHVEYKSATGLTWSVKATLSGELYVGGKLVIASTGYLSTITASNFSAGLSKTGGNLRITSVNTNDGSIVTHDAVAWGNGNAGEGGIAAPYTVEGKSISRVVTVDGLVQDTNNNFLDFHIADTPTPDATNEAPTLPAVTSVNLLDANETPSLPESSGDSQSVLGLPNTASAPEQTVVAEPAPPSAQPGPSTEGTDVQLPVPAKNISNLLITELLPNPASPVTDSEGEFIEIYNGNDQEVSLRDYKLQSGLKSSYTYTIGDVAIASGTYKVFYSKDTQLSLSNTSSKARLVAPDGAVISESGVYTTAKDGMSWSFSDGQWLWTEQPTPGADNILFTAPDAKSATAAAVTSKVSPKTPATKTAVKKDVAPKVPKTTKTSTKTVKTPKSTASSKVRAVYKDPAKVDLKSPIHYGVLAGIGSITLLYAIYEYRTDFQNRLFQLRRYLAYRRGHRQATQGE